MYGGIEDNSCYCVRVGCIVHYHTKVTVLSSPKWGINGQCIGVNLSLEDVDGRVSRFARDLGERRVGVKVFTGHNGCCCHGVVGNVLDVLDVVDVLHVQRCGVVVVDVLDVSHGQRCGVGVDIDVWLGGDTVCGCPGCWVQGPKNLFVASRCY